MEKEAKETQNYQILNTTKIESRADEIMSHLDTAPDEVKKAFEALLTVEREQNTLALGSKRLDEIEVLSRESSYLFFDGILQDTTIAAKKIKESLELIHKSEYLSTFLREDGLFSLEGREYQFIPFKKGINYGRVKPEELESASPDDIFYILQPSSFLENYSVPGEDPFMINVLDVCRVEFKEGVDSAPVINAYDGSITSKTHDSYKASEYYGFAPNSLAQTSLFPSGTALLEFRGQADENDKVISRGLIAVYDNVIKTATKRGKIRGYTIKYSERYAHFDVVTPNLLLDAIQNTTGMKFSNFYNQYLATAQFAYGYTNLDTDDGFSRTYIPGPSARYPTYNELWSQLRAKDEWESRLYAAYEKYIDKFTSLNDSAKDDINDKTAYREMLMEGYNKLYKTLESDEVFKYYKMSRIHRGGPPALTIEDLPGYRGEWEVLAQHGFDDIKGFSSLIDITNRIFTFLHERYLMDDPVDRVLPDVLLDEALETADSTLSKLEKGALLGNNSELNPEQVKTLLSGKRGTTVIGGGQSLKTNARVCDVKIDSLVVDKRASAKKRYSQQAEDALASVPEFKRFNEELLRSPYVDFAELDRSVLKGEEGGVNLNAATEALAYLNSMPLGSTSKIAFKVRLLGRHKALGLYYSSDKTVALDRRVKGWKSTLEHEVTHHYDHNNQDRYSRNAVVGWIKANTLIPENSQFKERKNYYMSDVELFARGGRGCKTFDAWGVSATLP